MPKHLRWLMWTGVLVLVLVASGGASPQGNPDPFGFKYPTGQSSQPIFEGWAKNPDGSFSMYCGYMNRNYVEQLPVRTGRDNKVEPGAPDRGQPTFLYTRIHRKAFSVAVPQDWGKKELVWRLTVRGKSQKALARPEPQWQIAPIYAGKTRKPESHIHKRPTQP